MRAGRARRRARATRERVAPHVGQRAALGVGDVVEERRARRASAPIHAREGVGGRDRDVGRRRRRARRTARRRRPRGAGARRRGRVRSRSCGATSASRRGRGLGARRLARRDREHVGGGRGRVCTSSSAGPAAARERVERRPVPPLGDVHHALEHRRNLESRSRPSAPIRDCAVPVTVERGRALRAGAAAVRLLGRRASRRCRGRRCATTPAHADELGLRLALAVGPPLPRHRQVRRELRARRRVRADRRRSAALARERRRASGSARSCSARRCGRRRCSPRRSPRSTASPAAGSTSGSAPVGTSPSTRRSAWTSRRRACGSPGCAEAVDDRHRAARRGRRPGHLRRPVPPRRRRAQPPDRGAAPAPAGVRRREGRPAAPARGRAGRRVEHLLGVDARGSTAERLDGARRGVRPRRARSRRRCGARSGSTRCAARTRPTSSGASSGCGPTPRRACSTARPSSSGGSAGSSAPSSRSGSRPRPGPTLGVETLILGVGRGPVPRRRARTTSPCWPRPSG